MFNFGQPDGRQSGLAGDAPQGTGQGPGSGNPGVGTGEGGGDSSASDGTCLLGSSSVLGDVSQSIASGAGGSGSGGLGLATVFGGAAGSGGPANTPQGLVASDPEAFGGVGGIGVGGGQSTPGTLGLWEGWMESQQQLPQRVQGQQQLQQQHHLDIRASQQKV